MTNNNLQYPQLHQLMYAIAESSKLEYGGYYAMDFPSDLLNSLKTATDKVKENRKWKNLSIPIADLNAAIKATNTLIHVSRGITQQGRSIPFWLLSSVKINSKSISDLVKAWIIIHYGRIWNYEYIDDLKSLAIPENFQWKEHKENIFDWQRSESNSVALPIYDNAFKVMADAIANYIATNGLNIGGKHLNYLKGPNDGEVQQWPPEKIYYGQKGDKFWFQSNVIKVSIQQRFFDDRPYVLFLPSVRRYVLQQNINTLKNPKTSVHIKAPVSHWCADFPLKPSIQSVALTVEKNEEKFVKKFVGNVPEILRFMGSQNSFISPETNEIVKQLSEVNFHNSEDKLISLIPYQTGLKAGKKKPVKPKIACGYYPRDLQVLNLAIQECFGDILNPVSPQSPILFNVPGKSKKKESAKLQPTPSSNSKRKEAVRKSIPAFIKEKSWKPIVLLSCFKQEFIEDLKTALQAVLGDDFEEIVEIKIASDKLANLFATPLSKSGGVNERVKQLSQDEELPALSKEKLGVAIVEIRGADSSDYGENDPKKANRKGLCDVGYLSQFFVDNPDMTAKAKAQKFINTVLDALRAIGITFPKEYTHLETGESSIKVPENLHFLCLRLLRITKKTAIDKKSKTLPLFLRISNQTGEVQCKIMSLDENAIYHNKWLSYSEALLSIGKNEVKTIPIKEEKDKEAIVNFIQTTLEKLEGNNLLLVEQDNVRIVWPNVQIKRAKIDKLTFDRNCQNYIPIKNFKGLRVAAYRTNFDEVPDGYIVKIPKDEKLLSLDRFMDCQDLWNGGTDKRIWLSTGGKTDNKASANASRLVEYPKEFGSKETEENSEEKKGRKKLDKAELVAPNWNSIAWSSQLKEISLLAIQPKDDPFLWANIVHDLRLDAIQWEHALELPLPLDLAKKMDQFFRILDKTMSEESEELIENDAPEEYVQLELPFNS